MLGITEAIPGRGDAASGQSAVPFPQQHAIRLMRLLWKITVTAAQSMCLDRSVSQVT